MPVARCLRLQAPGALLGTILMGVARLAAADPSLAAHQAPIAELTPVATIRLGRTADWVAVGDAVWIGSTGPDAVHAIDPATNRRIATVRLPGEPCAGLALGFGGLWVPLCAHPNALARVDLRTHSVRVFRGIGPAAREGGIALSPDSVWLVTDEGGSLARIDPRSGEVRARIAIAPGSHNPLYSEGRIWITRSIGAEVSLVDVVTDAVLATIRTGPGPRFLAAGGGSVWILNQGDGSLTQIDSGSGTVLHATALGTPGSGGDIAYADGTVWTTMRGVPLTATDAQSGAILCRWIGPGGDSLGIGHRSLWLTDYKAGTVARYTLEAILDRCARA